jgi:hypothetical protein
MWLAMGNEFRYYRDNDGYSAKKWYCLHQLVADSIEELCERMAAVDVGFALELHKTRLRYGYSDNYDTMAWFFVGFVSGIYEDNQDVTGPWIAADGDEQALIYKPENTKTWQAFQVQIAEEQQRMAAKEQAEKEKQAQERAKQDRVEYERLKKLFAPE